MGDGIILMRRAAIQAPRPWFHCDQSKDLLLKSFQGIYSVFESSRDDAGTVLIPASHTWAHDWESPCKNNFVPVPKELQEQHAKLAVKVWVPADSLLIFNSRLLHTGELGRCNRVDETSGHALPSRVAIPVALCPKSRRSDATRLKKVNAYEKGLCATHWADDRFVVKNPSRFELVDGLQSLPLPARDDAQ